MPFEKFSCRISRQQIQSSCGGFVNVSSATCQKKHQSQSPASRIPDILIFSAASPHPQITRRRLIAVGLSFESCMQLLAPEIHSVWSRPPDLCLWLNRSLSLCLAAFFLLPRAALLWNMKLPGRGLALQWGCLGRGWSVRAEGGNEQPAIALQSPAASSHKPIVLRCWQGPVCE